MGCPEDYEFVGLFVKGGGMTRTRIAVAIAAASAAGLVGNLYAQELVFDPDEHPEFTWESYEKFKEMDLSGQTIEVFGPFLGDELVLIEHIWDYFEAATGAEVKYSGSDSFEQQIKIDTSGGSAPDIAIFPQPGLAADLAADGYLFPLADGTADWVRENYAAGQSWVDLGTYAGKDGEEHLYAFFFKTDVKSLVWYSPENFEDAGYDVPATMEDLQALTQQIVDDGATPWCIGLGSGAATGWPATDWVEDIMLRTQTPEVYDAWVSNEIPFDDPRIVEAIETFGWFARNEEYVAGGVAAVAAVDFRDSMDGLFESPPLCYMHRQASFAPAFFPEDIELGLDADFFYFPAFAGKDLGRPVLGAGTLFAITRESEGAHAFIEFLKSELANELWMAQGTFNSLHKGVNTDVHRTEAAKALNEILLGATTFRFDGSDLMPGAIGAGSFWTGMVDYVGGDSASEVATKIQQSWNTIK